MTTNTTNDPIAADRRIFPSEDVLLQAVDNEAVLLDLAAGMYFSLNEVGLAFWQAVESGASLRAARDRLLNDYEVDRDTLSRDLLELVDRLQQHGLVRVE
jgi:hypothetical protein